MCGEIGWTVGHHPSLRGLRLTSFRSAFSKLKEVSIVLSMFTSLQLEKGSASLRYKSRDARSRYCGFGNAYYAAAKRFDQTGR